MAPKIDRTGDVPPLRPSPPSELAILERDAALADTTV
jgi:hypothetical protein